MLLWFKRLLIFLLLMIYGRGRYDRFLQEVTKKCKKRRNRRHVPGITEELDELTDAPDRCKDDISFVGFTKDGHIISFRIAKADKEYASLAMELSGIGRLTYSHSQSIKRQGGPLKLQMLAPMRRWKLNFSGRVECNSRDAENDILHCSVSLYWQCLADPFDHRTCVSYWQLAKNLSSLPWNPAFIKNAFDRESICYEQWGEMLGRIEIEGHESQFMRLKSFRKHGIERRGSDDENTLVSHHLIQDDGSYYITNGCVCDTKQTCRQRFGYITLPIGERWTTDQSEMEVTTGKEHATHMRYPFTIAANGSKFQFDELMRKEIPITLHSDMFDCHHHFTKCVINGKPAYGVSIRETLLPFKPALPYKPADYEAEQTSKLVMRLEEISSNLPALLGGKGANLSILNQLHFHVPKAICVTTNALRRQLIFNDEVRKGLESIESLPGSSPDISALCETAVQMLEDSDLCPDISTTIHGELISQFGEDFESIAFAVRSSGVSEDGSESSYAGQMDTFLGIKGLENILFAVRKCWASSVAFQTVEYRRQNGQPLVEPIAVVIQEMVDADVAGVLFTNDPLTSSTSTMEINAAPGLGEAVVSGKCTPDTIKVRRNRKPQDLTIITKDIGDKLNKVVCSSDNGTTDISNDENDRNRLCISDDQILEICGIGLLLENRMDRPQDIEWAISNGQIYLLQSRPITSRNEETDEELLHEFDSPLAMEKETTTLYNIGEMFPGVATTLTQDLFVSAVSDSINRFMGTNSGTVFSKYPNKSGMSFTNRPFLGLTACSVSQDCFMQDKAIFDISIAGRVLDEHGMDIIHLYKGGPVPTLKSLKAFVNGNFIQAPKQEKWYEEWGKKVSTISLERGCTTADQLYNNIDEHLHYLYDAWRAYNYAATRSMIPFALIFKVLQGSSKPVSTELNADMAVLLAQCPDVYTADVPRSLQKLAEIIAESEIKEKFIQLPDESGHACLMSADDSIRTEYTGFLEKHGHRCVKESEFMTKSWGSEPSSLMHALKLMINSPLKKSQPSDSNMTDLDQLKTPLSWFKKYLIRSVFLDKAKAGVASRELGKSRVVQTGDMLKRGYWKLAEMMVSEGRLPEEKLMFFLTHLEIGTLLETRSAALVRKARRRLHVFPRMEAIQYQVICTGVPVPLSASPELERVSSLVVKGMPVGRGVATGRACIVLTLDDAHSIQAGDILICPFTDVGWSPYFPLIAGLVTEMGGTISHGAVVAREVGIPCVVKAVNATRLFETGDKVKIDGLAGTLERFVD